MKIIPKLKLIRLANRELVTTNTDNRDKTLIENYINDIIIPSINESSEKNQLWETTGISNHMLQPINKNHTIAIRETKNPSIFPKLRILSDPEDKYDGINLKTLQNSIKDKVDKSDIPDLSNIVTKDELNKKADKSEIPNISNLATKDEVNTKMNSFGDSKFLNPNYFISNPDGTLPNNFYSGALTTPEKDAVGAINNLKNTKQDKLIPGNNITIIDNVISSTGGNGSSGESLWQQSEDIAALKKSTNISLNQKKLTNLAPAEFDDDAINFKQVKNYADTINLKLKNKVDKSEIPDLTTLATKEELKKVEDDTTRDFKNLSETIDTKANTEDILWIPDRDTDVWLKNPKQIDMRYQNIIRMAEPKNDSDAASKRYVDTTINNLSIWQFETIDYPGSQTFFLANYDRRFDYKFIINSKQNYTYVFEVPGFLTEYETVQISNEGVAINAKYRNEDGVYKFKINATEIIDQIKILKKPTLLPYSPTKNNKYENLDLNKNSKLEHEVKRSESKKDLENLSKVNAELASLSDLYPEGQMKTMLKLLQKESKKKKGD